MSLEASAIEAIEKLIKQAKGQVLISVPGRPHTFLKQIDNDGHYEFYTPNAPLQTLTLTDLDSLLTLALDTETRAILVGQDAVRLLLNDDEGLPPFDTTETTTDLLTGDPAAPDVLQRTTETQRTPAPLPQLVGALTGVLAQERWSHTLPLTKHPAFQVVESLLTTKDYDHKHFIRLLRTTLADFVDPADVSKLRTVATDAKVATRSEVGNGSAAFGRSVVEQARMDRGEEAMPDELELSLPVYDVGELREQRYAITLILEVAPNDGKPLFTVTARHNDVQAAIEQAQDSIVERAREVFPLVLRGSPLTPRY